MLTEDGIKKATGADFRTKFREIVWTADISKEMPIMVVQDKSLIKGDADTPQLRTPGSEPAITMSQAFLEKVQNHYADECMKMLHMSNEGYADVR